MTERTRFIRKYSGEDVLPSIRNIFIIEVTTIKDARHQNIKFDVLVRETVE